ncbi:hypothetical protein D9619_005280 [Psilocybe cf. subviscida]|uniref:Uncharacterized protein n=1 Tax=Psilocybe cf. subviscida TaxID=2480587 RepID=A0A8H5BYJ8_9AGAR|nr:hypothetical protein D9619_005280 [Psilocybe cf. subviscida]
MAVLPVELIHAILANITDHISMINLALTSRLNYATAMPVVLAEESRYVREVMIPGKHLSIYEYPDSRSKLPAARLDSPEGPFTGTLRKISFTPYQNSKYLCCIRRIVRRVKNLEQISMDALERSLRLWLTAYINICIGRSGVEFTLNGGNDFIPIAVDDEEPYYENGVGPGPMGRCSLPSDHPLHVPATPPVSGAASSSSRFYQRLILTGTRKRFFPSSGSHTDSGLIRPRINGLKLVNEGIFRRRFAPLVHALAAGEYITSLTFDNVLGYKKDSYPPSLGVDHNGNAPMVIFFTSLSFPSLTRLSIAHTLHPTGLLIRFLARHHLITELYLDVLASETFLPNLARLGGSAHSLLPFVGWRQSREHGGDDPGHLSALEELTFRTVVEFRIGTPSDRKWENDMFNAMYNVLFCAASSSAKPSKFVKSRSKHPPAANTEATIRIRSLTLKTLDHSHFIDWLLLEADKRQSWPILSVNAGVGIEKLMISEAQSFTMPVKTRVALLDALGRWCPALAREIEMDERARGRRAGTSEDADVDANAEANTAADTATEPYAWPDVDTDAGAQPDTIQEDDFTQRLLKRIIWHTFPDLQTLQIGDEKRDGLPAQRIRRPVGL